MKLISWLLCLTFTMNVFASTNSLEQVVDEYHYALSVEWDQNDKAFYDVETKNFFAKVEELMKAGLTQKEINDFVAAKIQNKEALNELSLLAANAGSNQELIQILSMNSEGLYSHGANWNGSAVFKVGVIAAVSALFIYSVYFSVKYGCIQRQDGVRSYCTDDNN